VRQGEGLESLKKIIIKRYPPRNFPAKSLWEIVASPPNSEKDAEFMMLYKANPKHPAIIEKMTEVVEIEVNDKAFRELTWLFKKYKVPCRPTSEGIEIKHVRTKSKFINDKNR
jgi:uncharacterized FlgJ-related protein